MASKYSINMQMTQVSSPFSPATACPISSNLQKYTDAINDWHLANFLQLNPQKSEIMFIGIPVRLKTPPTSINVAGTLLPSSNTLKRLGVTFDSHLSFKEHSASITKSCNHLVWSIRHIRPLLSVDTTSAPTRSLVLSRLDYCFPFSIVYLPLWSIPCNAYQNKLSKLVLLNPPLIALTAWRNCTGYWSMIASSSKSPSWHIELSRHPIHPISSTSFSAATYLVFAHLPPFNYTNQFTNHPSSTEASRMPLLLSGMHYPTS